MCEYIVADASVFILGKRMEGELITVPSVERELKDIRSRMALQISNVRVEGATKGALSLAVEAARETGDIAVLSPADLELLAKAVELGAMLATDDYAMQNVALHLGLKILPVQQPGIRRVQKRVERCPACGRRHGEEVCPVCGTPNAKRKRG